MGDFLVISPAHYNILFKVENSGFKFIVKVPLYGVRPTVTLKQKENAKSVYKITIGYAISVCDLASENQASIDYAFQSSRDTVLGTQFWMRWNNKKLKMGSGDSLKPLFVHDMTTTHGEIGYVSFNVQEPIDQWSSVQWKIEASPIRFEQKERKFFDEKPWWSPLLNGKLPVDATIGGFEGEPTYIARVKHGDITCTGKYILSQNKAYMSWGGKLYTANECEILCGYNLIWQKKYIYEITINAVTGGRSEHGPVFITRAEHMGKLLVGKVCPGDETASFPYEDSEVTKNDYDILVIPYKSIQDLEVPYTYRFTGYQILI